MTSISEQLREYWDEDSATYDRSASHHPRTALERAAWAAALRRLLPPPPARILDAGAGTGFLSLALARQGYAVTALDFSAAMLSRLSGKASEAGLSVTTVEGDAGDPPRDGFDAVVERHVLWTLPDPKAALEAWRAAAPSGRLLLVENLWGTGVNLEERIRAEARRRLRILRGSAFDHHTHYEPAMIEQLPFGAGASPSDLIEIVESTGWGPARFERLRDVEWATSAAAGSVVDRLVGVPPRFAITAG